MTYGFAPNAKIAYSEITHAWQTAREQLAAAGINIRRVPLFLTLGQPVGGIEEFFAANPIEFALPLSPGGDDVPLQIYGGQEGLFVCCKQTSVLGDFVQRWRVGEAACEPERSLSTTSPSPATPSTAMLDSTAPVEDGFSDGGSAPDSWDNTPAGEYPQFVAGNYGSSPTAMLASPTIAGPAATGGRAVRCRSAAAVVHSIEHQLNELERQLALADEVLQPESSVVPLSSADADIASEKFAALCRLISEDREPFCPLNGVVLLLPIELTDRSELAEQGGDCIQRDLQSVMRTMETRVSVQVVICGLASCEGGDELLARLSQDQLQGTLGLTLPTTPGDDPEAPQQLTEIASQWLCDELFPALVCRVLRRDADDERLDRADQEGNRRLHALVRSLRGRRQNLSRLLTASLSTTPDHWRLRGCFFAPTASRVPDRHVFAAGIVTQIQRIQNEVQWLESRRRRDSLYLAAAFTGYSLLAATALLAAALLLC